MTAPALAGHIPALVTPLRADGALDVEVLVALVQRATGHGASAVLVAGSTGEGPLLPPATRAALVGHAVAAAGGAPVVACASGSSLEELLEDVGGVVAAGASAVLVLAPSYFPLTPREQFDVFAAAADRSPAPVLAYHIPQLTGSELDPEVVGELAHHRNVLGMKDSSGDLERMRGFVTAAAGTDFLIFQGHGPTVREALAAGAHGSITAIANVRPGLVAAVHEAVRDGDLGAATAAQAELARLSHVLASQPGPLPVAIKAALQLESVIPQRLCVPPLRPLDEDAVASLREGLPTPG
jgi:4-hydroxy-tetrahydrodipicolinate synthase